jgi:hypothetical protein
LGALPADDIAVLEPQSNLLLGALDAVGAVADVAANIDGIIAAYESRISTTDPKRYKANGNLRMVPGADARGLVAPSRAMESFGQQDKEILGVTRRKSYCGQS